MAHFAEIDKNNIVLRVLVVPDNQEYRGNDYLANDCGLGGTWIQTSYNNRIRKQFASTGFVYNPQADIFIAPQPYPSWILDDEYNWQPPVPKPKNAPIGSWNEEKLEWEIPNDN